MKQRKIFVLLSVVLVLFSCGTKKKTVKTTTDNKQPKVHILTIQEKTIAAQPDFVTMSAGKAKFSLNYEQKQMSANGSVTFVKDSIFIVSVQPLLGIELLRLEATPQQLTVIDKMNKRYVQLTYVEVKQETGLPITFDDLQAIVMSRLFVVGKQQQYLLDNDIETISSEGKSTLSLREGKLVYKYVIDETLLMPLSVDIQMQGNKGETRIEYGQHKLFSTILFPQALNVAYISSDLSGELQITLPNLSFDGNVNAVPMRLNNYKKTTINAIISGK